MKSAVALRHIHFEDLGTLEPLLRTRGYDVQYIDPSIEDLSAPAIEQADLLVALGGPIGAFHEAIYPFLAAELELIQQRLRARRPLLGICLGAQLMARALGAQVAPMGVKEIGFGLLTLTPEGEQSSLSALAGVPVLHWHGDQFQIPAGTCSLASTRLCANQAFAVGDHALGLQFHLEADTRRIEHWLVGHASELAQAGIDACKLRTQAQAARGPLAAAAHAVFAHWLDRLEEPDAAVPGSLS